MADIEDAPEEIAEEPDIVVEGNDDAGLDVDDEDEEVFAPSGATEVKLYGKWAFSDIEVRDLSLEVSEKRNIYNTSGIICIC